jgi:metal-responsive CopG/Arc/MetJ family transcriptional regulator
MESITIKVEESLAKEISMAMKPDYTTKTEFIREAIRDKLEEIRTRRALSILKAHFGKAKVKTPLDEDEKIRERATREYISERGWD